MRLKDKPTTPIGATRTLRNFAWLPIELDCGCRVFFEYYREEQTYRLCQWGCGHWRTTGLAHKHIDAQR